MNRYFLNVSKNKIYLILLGTKFLYLTSSFQLLLVNADEQPQDIEFTVTTLNCSHSLERQSTVESDNGVTTSDLQRKVSTVGVTLGKFASLRRVKGKLKSLRNIHDRSPKP